MLTCDQCKQPKPEIRLDMQAGAFGPLAQPTCEQCYAKDCAERRAEGKRLGYRPRIVPWGKLDICV